MKGPTVSQVKEFFHKNILWGSLWIPTKTRNELIADEGFSSSPKMVIKGRVYLIKFKNIGGGMWEVYLTELKEAV